MCTWSLVRLCSVFGNLNRYKACGETATVSPLVFCPFCYKNFLSPKSPFGFFSTMQLFGKNFNSLKGSRVFFHVSGGKRSRKVFVLMVLVKIKAKKPVFAQKVPLWNFFRYCEIERDFLVKTSPKRNCFIV